MGVNRHELVFQFYQEIEEYQLCKKKFEQAGWIPFLKKFKGYHDGFSSAFTQNYDGKNVQLGGPQLKITEATRLPAMREKYFNGVSINKELYQKFLTTEHLNLDWTKGIPKNWVKEEYRPMLNILQRFLTCEGRYVVTFIYHLRVLLHF